MNFIPYNDSFVPKKTFFPVQFDNLEHAVGLIGVYSTGEQSSLVRTCRVH